MDSMKAVLQAVVAGQSVSDAAREYRIHKTALYDHVTSGKAIHSLKPELSPYLSPKEEGNLGNFPNQCAKLGNGVIRMC